MRLGEKQRLFSELVGELIRWIYNDAEHPDTKYAISLGDAYRDPRVFGEVGIKKPNAYGRKSSNHKIRLAIDLNLFRWNGERWIYCQSTEDHRPLGEYWESLSPLCSWGGHFADGNHYSFTHGGRR